MRASVIDVEYRPSAFIRTLQNNRQNIATNTQYIYNQIFWLWNLTVSQSWPQSAVSSRIHQCDVITLGSHGLDLSCYSNCFDAKLHLRENNDQEFGQREFVLIGAGEAGGKEKRE